MKTFFDLLARILFWLTVVLGSALIVVVVMQVISRYLLAQPIFWTEEVSRFLFIAIIALGSPLAVRSGQFARVDFFVGLLPPRLRRHALAAIDAIVAAFLLIVAYQAVNLIRVGHMQKSSVLGIPMSYIFSLMLICPALTALFFVESAVDRRRKGAEDNRC